MTGCSHRISFYVDNIHYCPKCHPTVGTERHIFEILSTAAHMESPAKMECSRTICEDIWLGMGELAYEDEPADWLRWKRVEMTLGHRLLFEYVDGQWE